MKLKIYYKKEMFDINVKEDWSLKEIFYNYFNGPRPKVIQTGGPLGELYRGIDIRKPLNALNFYEDSILFLDEFCPVDYARFMIRFVIRELNIVNNELKSIYNIVDGFTRGEGDQTSFDMLELLLKKSVKSKGEVLLYKNIKQLLNEYSNVFYEHINGHCQLGICRGLIKAQCINACPAKIHIPGFVALMKEDRYVEAYKLMRQENPLSSICGSVCARPCEDRCRRGEITGTVGVRALQRFISAKALESWTNETCLEDKDHSIAIIGGGPSGLTASYFLRRSGYKVTIFEKNSEAGGMLSFGVPKYRLPSKEIRREIETIESLGVDIKTDFEVGSDISFVDLRKKYDAVLIATGMPIGKKIDLEIDSMSGIDFLRDVHTEKINTIGNRVLVIGGGDVSMDCARTARRLGAEVIVMSLETEHLVPASMEERIQSKEEGVILMHGYGIDSIQGMNIKLKKCLDVFSDDGHFEPVFEPCSQVLENIDKVIWAIGQKKDLSFTCMDEQELNHLDDVFLAGDVISPTIVIDAIAQGKTVANEIDRFLGGNGLYVGESIDIPERTLNIRTFDDDLREIETLDVLSRTTNFDQVNKNYSFEDAKYEADRCMRCDRNSTASLLLGR